MKKIEKVEDLYEALDNAIDNFTNETIKREDFKKIIEELNQNEFDIKIDPDLMPDNRVSYLPFKSNRFTLYDEETSYSY